MTKPENVTYRFECSQCGEALSGDDINKAAHDHWKTAKHRGNARYRGLKA